MYFSFFYTFLVAIALFYVFKFYFLTKGCKFKLNLISKIVANLKIKPNSILIIKKQEHAKKRLQDFFSEHLVIKLNNGIELITDNPIYKKLRFLPAVEEKILFFLNDAGISNITINNGAISIESKNFTTKNADQVKFDDYLQVIASYIENFSKKNIATETKNSKLFLDRYIAINSILWSALIASLFFLLYSQVLLLNDVYILPEFNLNIVTVVSIATFLIGLWFIIIKLYLSQSVWGIRLIKKSWIAGLLSLLLSVNILYTVNLFGKSNNNIYSVNSFEIIQSNNLFGLKKISIDNLNRQNKLLPNEKVSIMISNRMFEKIKNEDRVFLSANKGVFNGTIINYISGVKNFSYNPN